MTNQRSVHPNHKGETLSYGNLDKWLAELVSRVELLEKTVLERDKRIEELENQLASAKVSAVPLTLTNKSQLPASPPWVNPATGRPVRTPEQMNVMNAVAADIKEREKRESNLIVFGIKKSDKKEAPGRRDDDKKSLEEVFDRIEADKSKIKSFYRIVSKKKDSHPLVVVLQSPADRFPILKAAKKLKTDNINDRIFINPDLCVAERELVKNLRKQCKEKNLELQQKGIKDYFYGIRDNMLSKLKARSHEPPVSQEDSHTENAQRNNEY